MITLCTHDIMILGGMNGKLLQNIYFLKNTKETCKPNNRDLNRDWITFVYPEVLILAYYSRSIKL